MSTTLMAMDRASVRRRDVNGFLHVEVSNISKANVCPYMGCEIPGWQALGLDGAKVYRLLRDPKELARGASSFNNVPILSAHVPVDAEQLPEELIIGTTGNDAAFDGVYLRNRLAIWSAPHQRAIDNHTQKELSSGYRYRPDMTPGTHEGLRYDGVMRDIVANHVALVIEGRAGPDVVVGDEIMKLKSRTALMISGALAASIRPLLAKDAQVDISTALDGVDAKSFAMDGAPAALAGKIGELVKPHLAQDATFDVDATTAALASIQPIALDEDLIAEPVAVKPTPKVDSTTEAKPAPVAMDEAAVRALVDAAEARGAARIAEIDTAKRAVQPHVGEVVGMDSAAAIYRMALDAAKVDLTDVDESAFKAMVAMLPKPGDTPAVALDAKAVTTHRSEFSKRFPNAAPLVRS
jgi:hypothetical protein